MTSNRTLGGVSAARTGPACGAAGRASRRAHARAVRALVRGGALGALLSALVCGAPRAALAQGTEAAATTQDARRTLLEAHAELGARRYREAQRLYRDVHDRAPSAPTFLGLARSAAGLGHNAEAVPLFEGALSAAAQALAGEARAQAERELSQALGKVARYRLSVEPSNAGVFVDEQPALRSERGEVVLDPGPHVLEVFAAKHAPQRIELVARAGEQREFGVSLERERELAPGLDRQEVFVPSLVQKERGPKRVWSWVMLGTAAAFTGTSVLFHLLAKADADEIARACPGGPDAPCTLEQIDRRINGSSIRVYDVLTNVSIGLAVGAAITSLVLFIVEPGMWERKAQKRRAAALRLEPGGLSGRF